MSLRLVWVAIVVLAAGGWAGARGAGVGNVARLPIQPLASNDGLSAAVPRVGGASGGRSNVPVSLLWASDDVIMYAGSLVQGTLRCDEGEPAVCSDTFYFDSAIALLYFSVTSASEESVIGLGSGSDIWNEFAWMEYCPGEGSLYMHRNSQPTDTHAHSCGTDHSDTYTMDACEKYVSLTDPLGWPGMVASPSP